MTAYAGRLIVYDREMHLESLPGETFVAGDTIEVIRGNGPREGDYIGTAIVTGFDDNCGPDLLIHFESGEWGDA